MSWYALFKDGTKLNKNDHLFKDVLDKDDLQLFAIDYFGIKIVLNIQNGSFTIIKKGVPIQISLLKYNLANCKLIYFERRSKQITIGGDYTASPGILQFVVIGFGTENIKKFIKIHKNGSIEIV